MPLLYYSCFGFVNLYSYLEFGSSVIKGSIINIVSVIGTIIVIKFLPDKKLKVLPKFSHSFKFYLMCMILSAVTVFFSGGYEDVLAGGMNGSVLSYLSLFFDGTTALALYLFYQKKIKYVLLSILLYILVFTLSGSRSAFIIVIVISLILPIFNNNNFVKNKLKPFLLVCCIASPMLFYYGTAVRGAIDKDLLLNLIVGRISMVELAAVPIESEETGKMNVGLYNDKYGISNQFRQSVNEVLPIDPFEHDINPNQYFRPIFYWEATELAIIDQYMSINLTLPIYFYLNSNFFIGILLTITFLSWLYYIWVSKNQNIYIFIGIIMSLYYLLQFFDWVMLTAGLFRMVLTIFTMIQFEKLLNTLQKK